MLKAWFKRVLAKQQALREHSMLKWMGPAVHHPRLWGCTRQGVALGIAAGLFFGFMIPVGQIPCAAVLAVFLRANTFGPIYYGAYCLGDWVLDMLAFLHLDPNSLDQGAQAMTGWLGKIASMGLPLLVGLALFAFVLSFAGYHAVNWLWRLRVKRAWRTRQLARAF